MKKLVLTLLVVAMAIPAFAADVTIDASGLIQITAAEGENVRGLAIIVESTEPITAVAKGHAVFNVFMDAAYEAEAAVAGSYLIGDGEPVADPDAKGTLDISAGTTTKISLCMGALDTAGNQAAVDAGVAVDVATITATGTVTITVDALRGGIVGDAVTADPDGEILATVEMGGDDVCLGDVDGGGVVDTSDLAAMVLVLGNNGRLKNPAMPFLGYEYVVEQSNPDWNVVLDYDESGVIDTGDLSALVLKLGNNGRLKNPAMPFLGYEYSYPCGQ